MTSLVKDENNRKVAKVCVGVEELRKEIVNKVVILQSRT